jgi:DnaJ like chaperone protein
LSNQSAYEILGLKESASQEDIVKSYKKMSVMYHPNKVAHLAPEFRDLAERRMKEINNAYDQLKRKTTDYIPSAKPDDLFG